ncbi:MAG: hypothetical protein ACJ8EF_17150 [Bradyrhizobium sp.]|jgi:hypothetical protein
MQEAKLSDTVELLAALKQQQAQLQQLLRQQLWVADAPKASLDKVVAQIIRTKRVLSDLEEVINIRREEASADVIGPASIAHTAQRIRK